MSVVIKTIKDYFNNYVYPKTKTKAVYDDSNNRLDTVLSTAVHFDNDSASGTISDPVLKQSDIATTLGTSDTVPASQKLVNTVNSQLTNMLNSQSFTPYIYDLDTRKDDLTNNASEFWTMGQLCFCRIWGKVPQGGITLSDMLQIRNMPYSQTLGGNLCFQVSGVFQVVSVQATSNTRVYPRPNVTGSLGSNTEFSGFIIGKLS